MLRSRPMHPDETRELFCSQQEAITHISHTLERMENSQERVIELLEKVANQGVRIDNLEDKEQRVYGDMNAMFARLRECELTNARMSALTSNPAYVIYGILGTMILTSFVVDLYCHQELMFKILNWLH